MFVGADNDRSNLCRFEAFGLHAEVCSTCKGTTPTHGQARQSFINFAWRHVGSLAPPSCKLPRKLEQTLNPKPCMTFRLVSV